MASQALAVVPKTPIQEFALLCQLLRDERHIYSTMMDFSTLRSVYRIYRANALSSLMPVETNRSGLGGDSKLRVGLVATPQELAEWCLALSRRMGINRDQPNAEFYVPLPTEQEFIRLSLPSQP